MVRKSLTQNEIEALRHIRDRIVRGMDPPSVRDLQELLGYNSPNAAAHIIASLRERGYVRRGGNGKLQLLREVSNDLSNARTVPVCVFRSIVNTWIGPS